MRIYANDIWMLEPATLRNLTKGVLREIHNRIDENPQLGKAVDLKQFKDACAVVNKSCQVLNQSMV